jgi:hypothetical protein
MKCYISETFLKVSGGLDNLYPYIQRVEIREYENGQTKIVRGKPIYLKEKKQHLLPLYKIALEAMKELEYNAPKPPKT